MTLFMNAKYDNMDRIQIYAEKDTSLSYILEVSIAHELIVYKEVNKFSTSFDQFKVTYKA